MASSSRSSGKAKSNGSKAQQADRVKSAIEAGTVDKSLIPFISDIKGQPYMSVDGRAAAAAKSALSIGTLTWVNVTEDTITVTNPDAGTLIVPPSHAVALAVERDSGGVILRMATGTEKVRKGGRGADSTHWVANAETSAIGRALGSLGFGLIPGAGLTTSEVMATVEEDRAEARDEAAKDGDKAKPGRDDVVELLRQRITEADALGSDVVNRHSIRNHVKKSKDCGKFETLAELRENGTMDQLIHTGRYIAEKIEEAREATKAEA